MILKIEIAVLSGFRVEKKKMGFRGPGGRRGLFPILTQLHFLIAIVK